MTGLDRKINAVFPGLVVRKDLVKTVRGNAIVPSYVLEYLLGQYCASDDEDTIQAGLANVLEILRRHYVHRSEAELVRSTIRDKGRHRVIDRISVSLNDREDVHEAEFANLGLKRVMVSDETVRANPRLLTGGVWCICDVEYQHSEDRTASSWLLGKLKPVQLSRFDLDEFLARRAEFTLDEWTGLLLQTAGFEPSCFDRRGAFHLLARLIPFCERNYNIMELGPKGTGKSHIYSEFSPHGILLSGGEVTVPKLFVNNATGRLGLVGYWDCVAFDEFAGKGKRVEKSLVDIMKNYMANKSFSRGVESLGAEASMAFVGNTSHTLEHMIKFSDLFCDLPEKFYDSAFLDRIHFYVPGWESEILHNAMFTKGCGFVVDYLAEILRALRGHDFSRLYGEFFQLGPEISTRDRDGIHKTFSGMMKLLFPGGGASRAEMAEILEFAMEGRKRVKDNLLRMDPTYGRATFVYEGRDGSSPRVFVTTLEERLFPEFYGKRGGSSGRTEPETAQEAESRENGPAKKTGAMVRPGHLMVAEGSQGICYGDLFGPYLAGAGAVVLTDPNIRQLYQARNLMEFLETCVAFCGMDVKIRLVTARGREDWEAQAEYLGRIRAGAAEAGIDFAWSMEDGDLHARHIVTDTGWKISLDRGLDIFQKFDGQDAFSFEARFQKLRRCKAFEITWLKIGDNPGESPL